MSKEAMKPVAWTDEDFTQLIVSEDIAKEIGATVPLYTSPPETAELLREIAALSANALADYKMIQSLMAEREPEPVACHTCKGLGRIYMGCGSWIHCDTCNTTGKATTPPKREPPCKTGSQCTTKCTECAEPEPVIDKSAAIRIATSLGWTPKREWQGLRDEEIDEGQRQSWVEKQAFESAVWWAEAKLKEKNNG